MSEDIPLPFNLPAVAHKSFSAAFDGGRITSDGGVMLLAQAERRLWYRRPTRPGDPRRDTDRVVHCCSMFSAPPGATITGNLASPRSRRWSWLCLPISPRHL